MVKHVPRSVTTIDAALIAAALSVAVQGGSNDAMIANGANRWS
jgi:hypothetical protein